MHFVHLAGWHLYQKVAYKTETWRATTMDGSLIGRVHVCSTPRYFHSTLSACSGDCAGVVEQPIAFVSTFSFSQQLQDHSYSISKDASTHACM